MEAEWKQLLLGTPTVVRQLPTSRVSVTGANSVRARRCDESATVLDAKYALVAGTKNHNERL